MSSNKKKIEVYQTPSFTKKKKKLRKTEIADLDNAVKAIIENPEIGVQKKGDLADVWVYKFKMAKQENLLAYKWDAEKRILIALGVHENFYRDLKKSNF
ncbi:type II toxin-antitoxin system RelE/ParE family toxin [Picosynechococcus sp. PCC 73109]|uniref:type II toxin-antitoxin system RelE/ParE family toxin n=1 Tax=Picosynechococcus sp. PCC 73109 TaxID=374982 RepID=UPI0007457E87|nr:type II toxin-antitoxin system RelE/ParE family toxin [Picosynechococcus sp. PCC 73109]AMA08720.1 addiction module toxin RelE [Picosynechococcus sp. PCC 73109]